MGNTSIEKCSVTLHMQSIGIFKIVQTLVNRPQYFHNKSSAVTVGAIFSLLNYLSSTYNNQIAPQKENTSMPCPAVKTNGFSLSSFFFMRLPLSDG